FIKQFWRSAEATTDDNGEVQITATIDGHSMSITEASLRRHLKLDDQDGITSIPNSEIFEHLALMGYHTDSDNPKKTAWEQFSSNIAAALICLAINRKYNFSRMIFEHMEVALFPTMLDVTEYSTSPTKITSSPSHSSEHSPSPTHSPSPALSPTPEHITAAPTQPSPTQPSPIHQSPGAEHHFPTPHPLHVVHSHGSDEGSLKLNELMNLVTKLSDRIGVLEDDLKKTKKTYSSAYTNLILRVKKLESQLKTGKARRKSRIVLSDDEVIEDDSSKHGRKLSECRDQEGSEKASDEVSTAGAKKGTASEEDLIVSSAVLSFAEAIRLEEQMNKEQRVRLQEMKRLRQWDEEERQRAMDEAKFSKQIYWNGPSVIREWSYNEIRPIFEKVWDFNQNIEPMDVEHGSKKKKSPKKMKAAEKMEEEDVATQKEMKEVSKETGAKRKKSIPRKKEEVPIEFSEEMAVPRTTCLLSEMLEDFDRQDVEELYRLVKEKYSASRLEGFDLMLWGDLYTYWKLEVDHESSQAFELLRFIRSQVQKVEEMFERIISKRRRLKDLIQKKLGDLKEITSF
ncbi:hypothetical protein Tco_0578621, partial [Tanacetum coccineum]